MKNHSKKAFTLVELIAVLVIVVILSTLGFISYSKQIPGARDANRISTLADLSNGLELYNVNNGLPMPDDYVDLKLESNTIGHQGYIGKNVLAVIGFDGAGKDPRENFYYSYFLSEDRKHFQILGFLEESDTLQSYNSIFNSANATVDYTQRIVYVLGNKLGILTDTSNTPIQEIPSIVSSGSLDITSGNSTEYIAYFSNTDSYTGSGTSLLKIAPDYSCKRIKEVNPSSTNGSYDINPNQSTPISVYCEMETYGGGWTLIASADKTGNWPSFDSGLLDASFSGGTYDPKGKVGNYYLDWSSIELDSDKFLFQSGNKTYWFIANISDIKNSSTGQSYTFIDGSKNNLVDCGDGAGTGNYDEFYSIARTGTSTDPYINGGDSSANGFIFWRENGSSTGISCKNSFYGIKLFVK